MTSQNVEVADSKGILPCLVSTHICDAKLHLVGGGGEMLSKILE